MAVAPPDTPDLVKKKKSIQTESGQINTVEYSGYTV